MKSVLVTFEGRVQGVGFRYSVKQIAAGFDITGWIRNQKDGSVLLRAQGEEEELEAFLTEIDDSHLGGLIRNKTTEACDFDRELRGFAIVRG